MPGLPAHHPRRRGRRPARVHAAAAAAMLVTIVAAQPLPNQSPQTTPPTPAPQHTEPAVGWNTLTAHIGLTTTVVPAATTTPPINADQALAIAATLGLDDLAPGQPTTELRYATSTHPEPGSIGADRLVWMLVYPNSPPILTEPPGIGDQQRHQLHDAQCVFVIVIDAITGQAATTAQHCQPP